MKVAEIREVAERRPFRPFTVRLSNGAQYRFPEPRSLGAPQDYHILFYFGETQAVLIDTESIVEVVHE